MMNNKDAFKEVITSRFYLGAFTFGLIISLFYWLVPSTPPAWGFFTVCMAPLIWYLLERTRRNDVK